MQHLFVYGTLLFPKIVSEITGKSFKTKQVQLEGFKRFKVKGCDYPAVIPAEKEVVSGKLIENVDQDSLRKIIAFEGDDYKMTKQEIWTGKQNIEALVFVWNNSLEYLENDDWNQKEFEKTSLFFYIQGL